VTQVATGDELSVGMAREPRTATAQQLVDLIGADPVVLVIIKHRQQDKHVLQHITKPSKFLIHADSAYVVNAIRQKWIPNWRRNGWINSKGKPVANRDLWEQLAEEIAWHESVSFVKVKGHRGIEHNERCDRLADKAKRQHLDTIAKVQ
jgi:hypothetical protein